MRQEDRQGRGLSSRGLGRPGTQAEGRARVNAGPGPTRPSCVPLTSLEETCVSSETCRTARLRQRLQTAPNREGTGRSGDPKGRRRMLPCGGVWGTPLYSGPFAPAFSRRGTDAERELNALSRSARGLAKARVSKRTPGTRSAPRSARSSLSVPRPSAHPAISSSAH